MNANHGHPLALEIEEKPLAGDVKIRRISPWSWKDVMLLFMAMVETRYSCCSGALILGGILLIEG